VLRLITARRTNAPIGADLYVSTKTASVHVTSILRKLAASSRVQAAALGGARRAAEQPARSKGPRTAPIPYSVVLLPE